MDSASSTLFNPGAYMASPVVVAHASAAVFLSERVTRMGALHAWAAAKERIRLAQGWWWVGVNCVCGCMCECVCERERVSVCDRESERRLGVGSGEA